MAAKTQRQVRGAGTSPGRTFSRYKAGSAEASEAGGSAGAGRLRVGLGGLRASPPAGSLPFPRFPGSASLTRPPHPWAVRSRLPDSRARVPPADTSTTDSLPAQARGLGSQQSHPRTKPRRPPPPQCRAARSRPHPCTLAPIPSGAMPPSPAPACYPPRAAPLPAQLPPVPQPPARGTSPAAPARLVPARSLPAAALRHWRPPRSP